MARFMQFADGIDVIPLLTQLHVNPSLWSADTIRTEGSKSPHREAPDIWIRTQPHFNGTAGPYIPVFYPAWAALPALRDIIFPLATRFKASMIGNILITRIPPGREVEGHVDLGWGPEYFTCKAYVVLHGNADCVNWCEEERITMKTGEGWLFTNTLPHGVINNGSSDRISLIATFRVD